jgi:hypothetical protein
MDEWLLRCARAHASERVRPASIGAMNSYYIGRSALECLIKAHDTRFVGWVVCDLAPRDSTIWLVAKLLFSFVMLGWKAAKVTSLSPTIKEAHRLKNEREELVAPPQGSAPMGQQLAAAPQPSAGSNGRGPRAAAAALQAPARHDDFASEPEFMTSRQPPPPAAGRSLQGAAGRAEQGQPTRGFNLLNTLQAAAAEEEEEEVPEARGVCEGCGEYVMSNDEGRKREDDKYYHSECIKGRCGGCSLMVHANHERVNQSGVYWHRDCDSNRAESSRSGAQRARQEQSRS